MPAAITVNTDGIKDLVRLLRSAADAVDDDAEEALDTTVREVAAEARSNAAGFNTASTGELANAVDFDRSGLSRRVFADVRQGFFLEYGSPTTGGPRPWLSGPAERGSARLAVELGRIGVIR